MPIAGPVMGIRVRRPVARLMDNMMADTVVVGVVLCFVVSQEMCHKRPSQVEVRKYRQWLEWSQRTVSDVLLWDRKTTTRKHLVRTETHRDIPHILLVDP